MSYAADLHRAHIERRNRLWAVPNAGSFPCRKTLPSQQHIFIYRFQTEVVARFLHIWSWPNGSYRAIYTNKFRDMDCVPLSATEIIRAVCKYYRIRKIELIGDRRTANIVRPRFVAMYLLKHLTTNSYVWIGRYFGGRDHTSAMHAVRSIEEKLCDDVVLFAEIEAVKNLLGGRQ